MKVFENIINKTLEEVCYQCKRIEFKRYEDYDGTVEVACNCVLNESLFKNDLEKELIETALNDSLYPLVNEFSNEITAKEIIIFPKYSTIEVNNKEYTTPFNCSLFSRILNICKREKRDEKNEI